MKRPSVSNSPAPSWYPVCFPLTRLVSPLPGVPAGCREARPEKVKRRRAFKKTHPEWSSGKVVSGWVTWDAVRRWLSRRTAGRLPPVCTLGLFLSQRKKFRDSYEALRKRNPFVHQQRTLARGIHCYLGVCVKNLCIPITRALKVFYLKKNWGIPLREPRLKPEGRDYWPTIQGV